MKKNRRLSIGTFIALIFCIGVQTAYACSFDLQNITLRCGDGNRYHAYAQNTRSLESILENCPKFFEIKDQISDTVFDKTVIHTTVANVKPYSVNDPSSCYTEKIIRANEYIISATSVQPYCISPNTYCPIPNNYVIAPIQKMIFDLKQGDPSMLLMSAFFAVLCTILGGAIAKDHGLPVQFKTVWILLEIFIFSILITASYIAVVRIWVQEPLAPYHFMYLMPNSSGQASLMIVSSIGITSICTWRICKHAISTRSQIILTAIASTAAIPLFIPAMMLFYMMTANLTFLIYPSIPGFLLRIIFGFLFVGFILGRKLVWHLPLYQQPPLKSRIRIKEV